MASTKNISYGAQGDEVKKIQEALNKTGKYNLTVDGIWGKNTDAAVRDYQKNNGLTVDGIVGVNTWSSLFGTGTSGATGGLNTPTSAPIIPEAPTLPVFNNTSFDDTDKGQAAWDAKESAKDAVANYGDFNWDKQGQYDNLIKEYENRPDFSYDFNADALYQQYKDKYIQQGKMAMADTIGQASAMTGGYGNSYAQTVGNQAYQSSLQNLNDIIPELYQMAYDKYNQKGQDMLNMIGLLGNERAFAYGKWGDGYNKLIDMMEFTNNDYYNQANQYGNEQDRSNSLAQTGYENEFNTWEANNSNTWKQAEWDEGLRQWQAEFDEAKRQYDEQMAFNRKQYEDSRANAGSSGSSGGSSGGTSGGSSSGSSGSGSTDRKYQINTGVTSTKQNTTTSVFTGKTYEEAVQYAKSKGVPNGDASGIMTASEWSRRRSSYQTTGQGGAEVKNYSSYQDYLKAITEYLVDKHNN